MAEERNFNAWKESKELYGLLQLQNIARSQAQQAEAMQQQAEAVSRGNEALAVVDGAKLMLLQQQIDRESARQEVRKGLFLLDQGLKTIEAREQDEPLIAFLWVNAMKHKLAEYDIERHSGLEELATQSELTSRMDALLARIYQRVPEQIEALSNLAKTKDAVTSAAIALDNKWRSDYLLPLRTVREKLAAEVSAVAAEAQARQQAVSRSRISVGLSIGLMCIGCLFLLMTLVSIPMIGKSQVVTKEGHIMTPNEEKAAAVTSGLMGVAMIGGGTWWWRSACRTRKERLKVAAAASSAWSEKSASVQKPTEQLLVAERSLPVEPCKCYLTGRLQFQCTDDCKPAAYTSNTADDFVAGLRQMQADLQQYPEIVPHAFNIGPSLEDADLSEVERMVKLMGRLTVRCDSCKDLISVRAEHRGKRVQCPKCHKAVAIPATAIPDAATLQAIAAISGFTGTSK